MKHVIAVSLRTLLGAAIVAALALGARQARASSLMSSCLRCDVNNQAECQACCVDEGFDHGMCPSTGVPCLCWDD